MSTNWKLFTIDLRPLSLHGDIWLLQACRDRLIEMPELVKSVCRVLYYRQLTRLGIAGVECIASLAIDSILQMHLIQVS